MFTILNPEKNYWDCYTTLDVEEETGEILDDAVFRRNVALEELFNFEFEIVEMEFGTDLPQSFYDVAEIVAKCFDRTNNFMLDINMLNDSGYNKHSAFMNDRAVIYFLEAIE